MEVDNMKIGNLQVYGVIYKITNKINDKVYIGQTVLGFKKRYKGGQWHKFTHNQHLKNSAHKYGVDNFEVTEILDVAFSKIELDLKENVYIKTYNSMCGKFGYNKTDGGSSGIPNEEVREKLSIASKGERNAMYGKNPLSYMSEDAYKKLMEVKRNNVLGEKNPMYGAYGEKNPFYGRHHSEETKKILSKKAKERLAKHNPLKGRKFSEFEYGNNPQSVNNIKMTILETHEIIMFDSVKRCAEWLTDNNIVKTYGTGKWAINESIKKNKNYKGYYFARIRK